MSTFGKTGGFTGKALSSVDSAVEPVAFHSSAKFSVCVGDEELEGLAVDGEVTEGVGCGEVTGLPLSQINLFPLLIHVNFLPLYTFVSPELVHLAPAFGAGAAHAGKQRSNEIPAMAAIARLIPREVSGS